MFGKLANFLRLLGYDTEKADNSWPDSRILEYVIDNHLMLITRDKEFYTITLNRFEKNNISPLNVIFSTSTTLIGQLTDFFRHLKKYNEFTMPPLDSIKKTIELAIKLDSAYI